MSDAMQPTPSSAPEPRLSEGEAPAPDAASPDPAPAVLVAAEAVSPGSAQAKAAEAAAKSPTKRPCFHCGKLTSVTVLDKTGDLCWKCYRPMGYSIMKSLVVLTLTMVVVAGGILGYRLFMRESDWTISTKSQQDFKPREMATQQKLEVLRRHFIDGVSAMRLCEEYEIQPVEFERWRHQFFEAGQASFERSQGQDQTPTERRIAAIEQKLEYAAKMLREVGLGLQQIRRDAGQYEETGAQRYILGAGPPPQEKPK